MMTNTRFLCEDRTLEPPRLDKMIHRLNATIATLIQAVISVLL